MTRVAAMTGAISIVAVSGCSGDRVATSVGEPVFALDRDVAADIANVPAERSDVLPAFQLRLALQRLLTEHAVLSDEAMRRAIDGGDVEPTLAELTRNTDGLTLAMGLVYGPAGARAFDQLWTNHIEFFNEYAAAIRSGDDGQAKAVRQDLGHYENDFSDFVEVATAGGLDFETTLHVLHSHVGQLLQQADAWEAGDYDVAYATASDAYEHMDLIAAALAGAIAAQQPQVFPGDLDGPARSVCAASRLATGELVVAAADVELASRGDRPGDSQAASATFEVALSAARDLVGPVAADRLTVALGELDEASSVPAARTKLLSTEVDTATDALCSIVD